MSTNEEWMLVRADVLPDIFRSVLAAEADLTAGRVRSVSEATRLHGISRSAYYKYKGAVAPYIGKAATTMTVTLLLQDSPGVLSCVLSVFAKAGANILTVNQDSPDNGSARVALCARTDTMSVPIDTFTGQLTNVPGVRRLLSVERSQPKGDVL